MHDATPDVVTRHPLVGELVFVGELYADAVPDLVGRPVIILTAAREDIRGADVPLYRRCAVVPQEEPDR